MPRSASPQGPRRQEDARGPEGARLTRRTILSGAALLGAGVGLDRALTATGGAARPESGVVPFYGFHQGGIGTPPQHHLMFASFDVTAPSPHALRMLLERWTAAAATLTAGREVGGRSPDPGRPPADPGEAEGLGAARLTVTFGFGSTLFGSGGRDRFGLAHLRPAALAPLPPVPGELLDPARSGGDLCVQACADDPQVVFHAIHTLAATAGPDAELRWAQTGFRSPPGDARPGVSPRNLLGFRDGTDNLRSDDPEAMSSYVWLGGGDGPTWMRGGSYLITRRIQLQLASWDALALTQQEATIGRHKATGAPLGGRHEHDPVDLAATGPGGSPVIPADAHIRVASPAANRGQRILRRSYSYSAGSTSGRLDSGGRQLDVGLFFIAFVRRPAQQFIPLLRRLATHDALSAFTMHTGSAVFACPPGATPGGFIGEGLFM